MATIEQLSSALIKADAAGNAEDAKVFADEIRKMKSAGTSSVESPKAESPGMLSNIALGAIKGASRIGDTLLTPVDALARKLGVQNDFIGRNDRGAAVDDFMRGRADTDSIAYKGGDIAAQIAGTAGAGGVLAKGAASVPMLAKYAPALASGGFKLGGAGGGLLENAAIRTGAGAATGAIQAGMIDPSSAGFGAAVGGALPGVAQGLGVAGRSIGRAVAPMTDSGRERIIANFLKSRLGDKVDEVIASLEANKGKTPGFVPTTGQASGNADLATLGRVFSERNPGVFQDRLSGQREALANSVRSMGGDEVARGTLESARNDAVEGLYTSAKGKNAQIDNELKSLFSTPAVKQAINDAKTNAANRRQSIGVPESTAKPIGVLGPDGNMLMSEAKSGSITGKALHEIKMALDAAKNQTPIGGANKASLDGVRAASGDYVNWLENAIPEYGQAKNTFSAMSKPINQMDLGNAIADKYIPAIYRDVPIPGQLNHAKLAEVLHNLGDGMAKKATGFKGATLKNTLSAEQMKKLTDALSDSQMIVNGQRSGAPVNSSTFQNLAFNADMEPSAIGGLLTKFGPVSRIAGILGSGRDALYGSANKKITGLLGDALADPEIAKGLLSLPAKQQKEVVNALLGNPAFRALATEATAQ